MSQLMKTLATSKKYISKCQNPEDKQSMHPAAQYLTREPKPMERTLKVYDLFRAHKHSPFRVVPLTVLAIVPEQ